MADFFKLDPWKTFTAEAAHIYGRERISFNKTVNMTYTMVDFGQGIRVVAGFPNNSKSKVEYLLILPRFEGTLLELYRYQLSLKDFVNGNPQFSLNYLDEDGTCATISCRYSGKGTNGYSTDAAIELCSYLGFEVAEKLCGI